MAIFRLKLNSFWKSISVVSGGALISQIIVLVSVPILSRIYLPENFGLQSIYLSFSLILGSLFTLKFEYPIVFVEKEKDSFSLVFLTISLSLFFSLILFLTLILGGKHFFSYLDIKLDYHLIFSIVITTFLIGILSALLQFTNRHKRFKTSTNTNIIQSVVNVVGTLIFGIAGLLRYGLIYGYLFGYFFSVIFISLNNFIFFKKYFKESFNLDNLKNVFISNIDYPKVILPTTVFSILSSQMIPIILQKLYTPEFVGFFSMSNRIALLPSIVIGAAIGSVLRTEISIMENRHENIKPLFTSLLKKMFLLGILAFSLLGVFAPWIFKVFLGTNWFDAGILTRSVVLYAFSIFMVQSFYDILLVKKKYKTYFLIQFSLFITISFSLILGNMLFGQNPFHNVTFMAICVFVVLMISLFVIYRSAE